MASEHDFAVLLITVFKAIIFAPLVVVGLLILLASWLAFLDALSWSLYQIHEYRARRAINDAVAQNMDDSMVENGMIESFHMGRQVADMRQGSRPGERAGSNTEELLIPANTFTDGRVWWAIYS